MSRDSAQWLSPGAGLVLALVVSLTFWAGLASLLH